MMLLKEIQFTIRRWSSIQRYTVTVCIATAICFTWWHGPYAKLVRSIEKQKIQLQNFTQCDCAPLGQQKSLLEKEITTHKHCLQELNTSAYYVHECIIQEIARHHVRPLSYKTIPIIHDVTNKQEESAQRATTSLEFEFEGNFDNTMHFLEEFPFELPLILEKCIIKKNDSSLNDTALIKTSIKCTLFIPKIGE